MPRFAVEDAFVIDGPLFMEMTEEEGPQETYLVQVGATVGGKDYVLAGFERRPARRIEAQAVVDRVRARGTVDLALWVELPPRMSLEERFAIYAQNEAEVRMGFRDEADLYHGV
jgi:hypothetical protein